MYSPDHFRIDDEDVAFEIIERRGVGTLVVAGPDGFEASLIPWLAVRRPGEGAVLRAHVSRANPLVEVLSAPLRGIVIFDLADGYVSPSWYPSKAEHHRVVPTWNYAAVHVHGMVGLVDDTDWKRALVTELTDRHEAEMAEPWKVTDAPADYVEGMLRGIVGVEMRIDRIEAKAKLSQNRSADDIAGVRQGLATRPQPTPLETVMESFARRD